jgi:hypothetical protein
MRLSVRSLPWLLALVGLAVPLVGDGFVLWRPIATWLVILALIWLVGRVAPPRSRAASIALAIGLLPVLLLLAWEGGWWLIPADLAWLAITVADRREVTHEPITPDETTFRS